MLNNLKKKTKNAEKMWCVWKNCRKFVGEKRYNMEKDNYRELAKSNIKKMTGASISVLKDFDHLSANILQQTQEYISPTTLRRFWGYQEQSHLRPASLDIIARYIGYSDWDTFCEAVDNGNSIQSGTINRQRLQAADLTIGALVELRWEPDRCIVVRYEGDQQFCIVSVENSKLRPDGTFRCMMFLENEPLYLASLTYPGEQPHDYVCGQKNGIRFREMKE